MRPVTGLGDCLRLARNRPFSLLILRIYEGRRGEEKKQKKQMDDVHGFILKPEQLHYGSLENGSSQWTSMIELVQDRFATRNGFGLSDSQRALAYRFSCGLELNLNVVSEAIEALH